MGVRLKPASVEHEAAFLAAARASRPLHRGWVVAPTTPSAFRRYMASKRNDRNVSYFVFSRADDILGVVNISEIVRGPFRSAYLGYYVFAPHQRRGVMTAALAAVVTRAFRAHRLHRLEANIQPANVASIRLVRRLGSRLEGLSRRYLKIAGRWQDHERWAVTREEWRTSQ